MATISIRIPRVGDDVWQLAYYRALHISIRIPRVGDDLRLNDYMLSEDISIRIPRVGDDSKSIQKRGFCFVSLR